MAAKIVLGWVITKWIRGSMDQGINGSMDQWGQGINGSGDQWINGINLQAWTLEAGFARE